MKVTYCTKVVKKPSVCFLLILNIFKGLRFILHHSENKRWKFKCFSDLDVHSFFLGNFWLEELSYRVCTVPTATELSCAAHGTGGHWALGAIDASKDELFEKLQVPKYPAPSYENGVV